MSNNIPASSYKTNLRLILIAAVVILGLWFAYQIISVLLLFFFAVVLTLILNAPTMWLISKKVPRTAAALIVFFLMLLFLFFLGWLIIPKILNQVTNLIGNIPAYTMDLKNQVSPLLKDYPALQKKFFESPDIAKEIPSTANVLTSISRFSFSIINSVFLMVIFFSIIVYMLINPAPLIETYLLVFPQDKRPKATYALARASSMMVAWLWSNLFVGIIEAVAVFIFLSFIHLPGVWVWAGLALFAELVPRLGLYIMAIPPVLVALSIHPVTALWVLGFYLVLNEITGDFILPKIRATTMNLHPVSTLFVMLAMAKAFGLAGALIATPLTAFIKAYYETFFLSSISKEKIKEQVEIVLNRDIDIKDL
jgi:putative permease